MQALLIALFLLSPLAHADAPANPNHAAYRAWLESLDTPVSPFFDDLFAWNEAQEKTPLPAEVARDPQRLFVSVQRPLAETIRLEDSGEIEESVTLGLESYGQLNAPVSVVLETVLFRSGKPVGKTEGTTYPHDSIFGFRQESLRERWGQGAYYVTNKKTGGGIVRDQNDSYTMLVRGNAERGYLVLSSFLAPVGATETKSALTIVRLVPLPGGRTDYRISSRFMGQSYGFFGKEAGRANFGFNVTRIRQGQLEFYAQVKELMETGKISERR
jgi:hypothetical protein